MITKRWIKDEIAFFKRLEGDATERLEALARERERAERNLHSIRAHIEEWRLLMEAQDREGGTP